MKLTSRLALVFIFFAAVLLATVGWLSYTSGRGSLRTAAISELLATAIEKQAAFYEWVDRKQSGVALLASDPGVISSTEVLIAADPGSSEYQSAHKRLVEEFKPHLGLDYFSMFVMDPDTGRVIAAVDPGEEGKIQKDRLFFIHGRTGPYVENVYYSVNLQEPAMTAAAPLLSADGQVLAVLAGRLNLEEMNAIFGRRTGLRQTDDAFLLNSDNLLLTQPRFLSDPGVLQQGIHTEAAERCLVGSSGVHEGEDYRGIPSIIVYRWLPERSLCLIAKMEQAEAYAPARAFGNTVILISVLALGGAALSALVLSQGLTRPILALKTGAEIFGRGDLDYRIPSLPRNEIGLLGAAFNEMAASLKQSLGQTAHGQKMLVALSQAAVAVQRARSAEEVYSTVGQSVSNLGFHITILNRVEDKKSLQVAYINTNAKLLQAVEKLAGLSVKTYRLSLETETTFQKVMDSGEPVFIDPFVDVVKEMIPASVQPMANSIVEMMGLQQAIAVPLGPGDLTSGILTVAGKGLAETDLPAISTFANQISTALENIQLYEQTQAWAHELEARVERRTAELKVSEEKFRGAFEHAAIGRAMANPQGQFVQINQAFCDILGYSMEEVLSKRWMDVTHPDHIPVVSMQAEKLLKGDTPSFQLEIKLLPKEGEKRLVWANLNVVLTRDSLGQPLYMIGDIVDVTEREVAVQVMRLENERFLRFFDSNIVGIVIAESSGRILMANDYYLNLLGVSREDFLTGMVDWRQFTPPEWLPADEKALRELTKRGVCEPYEKEYVRADGTRIPVYLADAVLPGPEEQIAAFVLDISSRKDAEMALQQITEDLRRSNAELEQFAYVASHDLQEPLRMVSSYVQLLGKRYQGKLDQDADEFIAYAVDGAKRMQNLINDLLSYSRVGTRGNPFDKVSSEELLKDSLMNLQFAIEECNAEIGHGPLPVIKGDPVQMGMVFQNLLGNAIKFRGPEKPCINVSAHQEGDEWVFSVRDNGIGIDPKFAERIFIIFQRLNERGAYPGTGIGLAICKRIIQRHGGRIWVESQPGKGATFYFTIPIQEKV